MTLHVRRLVLEAERWNVFRLCSGYRFKTHSVVGLTHAHVNASAKLSCKTRELGPTALASAARTELS